MHDINAFLPPSSPCTLSCVYVCLLESEREYVRLCVFGWIVRMGTASPLLRSGEPRKPRTFPTSACARARDVASLQYIRLNAIRKFDLRSTLLRSILHGMSTLFDVVFETCNHLTRPEVQLKKTEVRVIHGPWRSRLRFRKRDFGRMEEETYKFIIFFPSFSV